MSKSVALAGACLLGLFAIPAYAAPGSDATMSSGSAMAASSTTQFISHPSAMEWRASKLSGIAVYGPNNQKIGTIDDILLNSNGQAQIAVIAVGGFLGVGQKDVGVPFSQVTWRNEAEGRTAAESGSANTSTMQGYPASAMVNFTKTQLKNAPDFHFSPANHS